MKQKIFTFFLALVASAGTIFAESGTCGENLTWELSADGVLTINGTGAMNDFLELSDVPWFPYSPSIIAVVLNDGVTSIGSSAFSWCSSLTSIDIPNSVTSIGNQAFGGCTGLTSIDIPNSVISIGKEAFYYCTGLTSVTIPESVTTLGQGRTFGACTALTKVQWNAKNCILEPYYSEYDEIFWYPPFIDHSDGYNYNYIEFSFGNQVESIPSHLCSGLAGLKMINLPNSVTSIGDVAFLNCTGLTSIEIPNSVTSIGASAFAGCKGLSSVTIGNSVISIGEGAFYYCTGLTSVTCLATTPPELGMWYEGNYYGTFYGTDCSKISLYVPTSSEQLYKEAEEWKDFGIILPISAKETETTEVTTKTSGNSVEIIWPSVSGAYTYELVIKDKSGNVICTLIFNNNGQLISIAFNAPSRDGAPQKEQTAGFSFTVTGLETGTSYDLTITAKNESGQELDKKNVTFHTDGTQAIEDIHVDSDKPVKVLHEGQVYILNGEKSYTITGQEL